MGKFKFKTEAELCAAFIAAIPEGWTAYPETCGFDIVLSHKSGAQIGIEAKLALNAAVLGQAYPHTSPWRQCQDGPDFRAILVPYSSSGGLSEICRALGVNVLRQSIPAETSYFGRGMRAQFDPPLPFRDRHYDGSEDWVDWCPSQRLRLPDYVPDVSAGKSGPTKLTDWKIGAIKICITLEKRGFVTEADFKHHRISIYRWIRPIGNAWLQRGDERGRWIRSHFGPNLRAQHPVNYTEIEADYEVWKLPDKDVPAPLQPLGKLLK